MGDPQVIAYTAQHSAPAVHHVVHHAAHHVAAAKQGISMLTIIISNLITAAVAAGLAWYIRGRGLTGVSTDINNLKNDVANLKAKISPAS